IGAQPRLWTCRDPQRHEPFPLDLSGSGEHSYGCPFGPPRIAEVWQHQRSRFGPNGQPPESSQLVTPPSFRQAARATPISPNAAARGFQNVSLGTGGRNETALDIQGIERGVTPVGRAIGPRGLFPAA